MAGDSPTASGPEPDSNSDPGPDPESGSSGLRDRFSGTTGIVSLTIPSVLWMVLFLLIPLLIVLYYSFLTYTTFSVENTLTLEAWQNVFGSATTYDVFARTVAVGLVVTLVTLVFGYPIAYYLRFHTSQNGGILLLLFLVIPFWTSAVIRTIGWFPILGRTGFINQSLILLGLIDGPISWLLFSPFSQLVGYLQNYIVFMAAPIFVSLTRVEEDLLDASETLRGNPIETFRHVTWPLSLPGVAIGCIFVFVLSIGDFTIPQFLSGGDATVSTLIFLRINTGLNYPAAAALSITLLIVIFLIVYALVRVVDISEIAEG